MRRLLPPRRCTTPSPTGPTTRLSPRCRTRCRSRRVFQHPGRRLHRLHDLRGRARHRRRRRLPADHSRPWALLSLAAGTGQSGAHAAACMALAHSQGTAWSCLSAHGYRTALICQPGTRYWAVNPGARHCRGRQLDKCFTALHSEPADNRGGLLAPHLQLAADIIRPSG